MSYKLLSLLRRNLLNDYDHRTLGTVQIFGIGRGQQLRNSPPDPRTSYLYYALVETKAVHPPRGYRSRFSFSIQQAPFSIRNAKKLREGEEALILTGRLLHPRLEEHGLDPSYSSRQIITE
jgi:hypothetical protein